MYFIDKSRGIIAEGINVTQPRIIWLIIVEY